MNCLQKVQPVLFQVRGDERGGLVAVEGLSEVCPFEVKRCYYIFDTTPGTVRGKHAHRKLKQLLVCVSGACTIRCELRPGMVEEYVLDWPDKGLLVEGMVWHEMVHFSKGAVLMVLASDHYDEADYIRNYQEFKDILKRISNGD